MPKIFTKTGDKGETGRFDGTRVPKNDGPCVRNGNQLVGALPLLRIEDDAWVEFEERAAILEFDGGYSREEAERLAQIELGISTDDDDR